MKGEVIGINAAKYSSTEVEGMGYAIPISQAQDIINELMNKKTRVAVDEADQGYLGIQGQNIDRDRSKHVWHAERYLCIQDCRGQRCIQV